MNIFWFKKKNITMVTFKKNALPDIGRHYEAKSLRFAISFTIREHGIISFNGVMT